MNKLAYFFICSTFLANVCSYAKENEKQPHHLYIGPELFSLDLNIPVNSIEIEGSQCFYGLRMRYEYLKPQALYAGADLFYAVGTENFHAKYWGFYLPEGDNLTAFGNFEFRLGYTLASKRARISPFLGTGIYILANNASYFYFHEKIFYIAGGMRFLFDVSRSFSMGLNGKVFLGEDTEQRFKYLLGDYQIKHDEDPNIWGGEIGIPFVWYMGSTQRWEVQMEPLIKICENICK